MGRAEADITQWVEYFVRGMAVAFENVLNRMDQAQKVVARIKPKYMRKLDPKQRKALELFIEFETITASQIGKTVWL